MGGTGQRVDDLVRMHAGQQAVVRVVDQLGLLLLLDHLDRQAQLVLDLVVRAALGVAARGCARPAGA